MLEFIYANLVGCAIWQLFLLNGIVPKERLTGTGLLLKNQVHIRCCPTPELSPLRHKRDVQSGSEIGRNLHIFTSQAPCWHWRGCCVKPRPGCPYDKASNFGHASRLRCRVCFPERPIEQRSYTSTGRDSEMSSTSDFPLYRWTHCRKECKGRWSNSWDNMSLPEYLVQPRVMKKCNISGLKYQAQVDKWEK